MNGRMTLGNKVDKPNPANPQPSLGRISHALEAAAKQTAQQVASPVVVVDFPKNLKMMNRTARGGTTDLKMQRYVAWRGQDISKAHPPVPE
jgi:hypothetical protein